MSLQKKVNIGVCLALAGFLCYWLIRGYIENGRLKLEGVYVLGVRYKFKRGGHHGGVSSYKYLLNNKIYEFDVEDSRTNNDILFFKILPSNPKVCRIMDDTKVPQCLTMKDVPMGGWKELPNPICDSN